MRSPGMASDLDQEVATIERVTSGGTWGTTTSSNTSARYGSSLISTIGRAARASSAPISANAAAGEDKPPRVFREVPWVAPRPGRVGGPRPAEFRRQGGR